MYLLRRTIKEASNESITDYKFMYIKFEILCMPTDIIDISLNYELRFCDR